MNHKIILTRDSVIEETNHYVRNALQVLSTGQTSPKYRKKAMISAIRLIYKLQRHTGVENYDTRTVLAMLMFALPLPAKYQLMAISASIKRLENLI